MHPTTEDFITILGILFRVAEGYERHDIIINSGELHTFIGGYPGPDHRMPSCCRAMRLVCNNTDVIIEEPLQGNGATLTIK